MVDEESIGIEEEILFNGVSLSEVWEKPNGVMSSDK